MRPWWLPASVRVHAAWWMAVAVPLLGIEHATGLHRQFPLLYVIPVSLAAWYSGRWPALWEHLERFISRRSETQFSHGVCPPCQSRGRRIPRMRS